MIGAVCLYGLYTVIYCAVSEKEFSFTLIDLCKILVFNDFTIIRGAQLWFLPALIYCYILWFYTCRFNLIKVIRIMVPIILAIKILFLSAPSVSWQLRGNWLVTGIPYFVLGNWLRDMGWKRIPTNKVLLFGTGMGVAACLAYKVYPLAAFGTVILSIFIFAYCIRNPNAVNQKDPFVTIGLKYSLTIYIVHLLIGYLTDFAFREYASAGLYQICRPLIVLLLSICVSVLFEKIQMICLRLMRKPGGHEKEMM